MIERVIMPKGRPIGCVIALPGRGMSGREIAETYKRYSGLSKTLFVGITPKERQWYPMPNGVKDQAEAIAGVDVTMKRIERTTRRLLNAFRIRHNAVALVGYSAGAVMSLYTAINSNLGYAAAIGHSGALLEPSKVTYCNKPNLQLMMAHCKNDCCFFWDERYIPTKDALKKNGYNLANIEHNEGGHNMINADIAAAGLFLAPLLGYPPTWKHPCCIS